MSKAMDKMRAARIELIRNYVFFGSVAMALELVEDSSLPHAAATDGKRLIFTPDKIDEWAFGETIGVICHEVLHVMLSHHLRKGPRNHKKWNYACDYAVNAFLLDQFRNAGRKASSPTLPAGCLHDPQYADMSAEEIYNKLPDMENGLGFDDVMDAAASMSKSEVAAEEAKIRATVKNAAALSKKAGQMSDTIERLIEAICEPKANWRAIVRDYLTSKAETDYNWATPHQRMLHQYGIVYPTLDGEKLGNLVLLCDASGSCGDQQEQFCAEVSDILAAYECSLDVIFHDAKVTKIDHYESLDLPIVMRPSGFGGTDVSEAFRAACDFDPDLIIWMTDLEVSFSNVEVPGCDVIIACSNKRYFDNCPSWAKLIDIS